MVSPSTTAPVRDGEQDDEDVDSESSSLVSDGLELGLESFHSLALQRYVHGDSLVDQVAAHVRRYPQWAGHYIDAGHLEKGIEANMFEAGRGLETSDPEMEGVADEVTRLLIDIKAELQKVNSFYVSELTAIRTRIADMIHSEGVIFDRNMSVNSYRDLRGLRVACMNLRKHCSKEVDDCHRLADFCTVNRAAFCAIFSICDELPGVKQISDQAQAFEFWHEEDLAAAEKEIEKGYAKSVCRGSVDVAKADLLRTRKYDDIGDLLDPNSLNSKMALTGIIWGMVFAMTIVVMVEYFQVRFSERESVWDFKCLRQYNHTLSKQDASAEHSYRLIVATQDQVIKRIETLYGPIYVGMAGIILWFFCWSFLVLSWERAGLNYCSILDLDEGDDCGIEALRKVGLLNLIFLFSCHLFIRSSTCAIDPHDWFGSMGTEPLLMYACIVIYGLVTTGLSLPLMLWRASISPCTGVSTFDGYVGDVLTSLIKPLNGVAYGGCMFFTGEFLQPLEEQGNCHFQWFKSKTSDRVTIIILIFPSLLRIAQNLRLLYNTGKHHPNLTNTGKYTLGLLVSLFGLVHELPALDHNNDWFFWVFLIPYLGATVYSFLWDIFMDWNLFSADRHCLCLPCSKAHIRKQRLFRDLWMYYVALAADFFLRFFGTYTLIPRATAIKPGAFFNFVQIWSPTLEILRRTMWSFFWLENKQLAGGMLSKPSNSGRTRGKCRMGVELVVVVSFIAILNLRIGTSLLG